MRTILVGLLWFVSVMPATAAPPWRDYLRKDDDWFRGKDGRRIADTILSHQSPEGSWEKNGDTTAKPYDGDPAKLHGTFDNGSTLNELRFLARAFNATKEAKYEKGFLKGYDHLLKAQYANGGWPQFYPPGDKYNRHITFNDHTMVRLMQFVREVATTDAYKFVDQKRRQAGATAFERGVECILKCQIVVGKKKLAWCAQHDEKDFSPRPARTYELVSLSGCESVEIVRLLMSLDKPSPAVVEAIESAVAWFESAKLTGIKVIDEKDAKAPKGTNKVVVKDKDAPPLWARFYTIETNKPIFCDRDGVAKKEISEIGYERRNGYGWYGSWPASLLEKEYPAWKKKHG